MTDFKEMLELATLEGRLTGELSGSDIDHMVVLFEAFEVMRERNSKYADLWMEYGARDSYEHMKSKFLRSNLAFTYPEDLDDAIDLINYTVFFIRNIRAGRVEGPSV